MRKLARLLSYLAAGLSTLLLVRSPARLLAAWRVPAELILPLGNLKVIAGPLVPWLVLTGGLGALGGWRRRDSPAVLAGLFGAAVATRYTLRVVAPHTGFADAFGPDWEARIPPDVRARWRSRRYTLWPSPAPQVPWQRDVTIGTHEETGDPLLADL